MLTGPYFQPFLGTLNLSKRSCSLPFRWSMKLTKVVLVRSKLYKFMNTLALFVCISYLFVLVHQLLTDFSRMTPAISTILLMWLTINVGTAYVKIIIMNKEKEMSDFFNHWINFEEDYFAGEDAKRRGADASVLLVLKLTYISVATFPLAISSYIALQPCSPPFITSFILQCKDPSELLPIYQLFRFLLATAEGMFWFHIVGLSAFFICFIQYLPQKCLRTYLSDLQELFRYSNVDKQIPIIRQASIYRQIQVLHNRLHSVIRGEVLPMAQTSWMIITIIALYTTIKLHEVIPMPLYLFFPMCAVDGGVFFYVVIGASSQSYKESVELVDNTWKIRKQSGNGTTKWFLKFKRSCMHIRTYVGSVGYLDVITPLAIIHFCLAQTGGLILLKM